MQKKSSKFLTIFFIGAKNGPKNQFFWEKKPKRCVFQKGGLVGWLVGLDALLFVMYVTEKNFRLPLENISPFGFFHVF